MEMRNRLSRSSHSARCSRDTRQVQDVPKATLGFHNSLELTEVSEAVILLAVSERKQINVSSPKRCTGQGHPGESSLGAPSCPLPEECRQPGAHT